VTLRIATANLRHGGQRGQGKAWHYLLGGCNPDLVFAQESFPLADYEGVDLAGRSHLHAHHNPIVVELG
jgi:hypothetical protein